MIKVLAGIALILAVGGYLDQEWRLNESWDWSQFWHHESLIVISAVAGVSLLIGEYLARRTR